jgi:hypothetical protein
MPEGRRSFFRTVAGVYLTGRLPLDGPNGTEGVDTLRTGAWDDTWTLRLKSGHRIVLDCTEVEDGAVLQRVQRIEEEYLAALGGQGETTIVVVLRRRAVIMALDDALWQSQDLGVSQGVVDPATGKPAMRNIFSRGPDFPTQSSSQRKLETLTEFQARGGIVLVCGVALRAFLGSSVLDSATAPGRTEIIPGAVLLPSGQYALVRAQEAGCVLHRD